MMGKVRLELRRAKPLAELVFSSNGWVAAGGPCYKSICLYWSELAMGGSRLAVRDVKAIDCISCILRLAGHGGRLVIRRPLTAFV